MFHTFKYKSGYIHVSYIDKHEIIRVQVDGYAYSIIVRSVHAAKILITKQVAKLNKVVCNA